MAASKHTLPGGFKSQNRGFGIGGLGAGIEQMPSNISFRKSALRKFAQFATYTASNFCSWNDSVSEEQHR